MQQSVVLPRGILSTCHGSRRRPYSLQASIEPETTDAQPYHPSTRRPISSPQPDIIPEHDLLAVNVRFSASASGNGTVTTEDHQPSAPDRGQPQLAVIDFGQARESAGNYAVKTSNPTTGAVAASTSEKESVEDERPSERSSGILNRLSYIAKSVARPHSHRPSIGSNGQSARQSFSSYVAQGIESYRAFVVNNTRSFRRSIFRLSHESYDIESYHEPKRSTKRNSKAIPKSWRFLGIDEHTVGHAIHGVKSNVREMYDRAKVKQQQIKRSKTAQLTFRYAFYIVLISMVYLVFVGLPLWRGLVWYMYILFQNRMTLKAGLAITFGISFLQVNWAIIHYVMLNVSTDTHSPPCWSTSSPLHLYRKPTSQGGLSHLLVTRLWSSLATSLKSS